MAVSHYRGHCVKAMVSEGVTFGVGPVSCSCTVPMRDIVMASQNQSCSLTETSDRHTVHFGTVKTSRSLQIQADAILNCTENTSTCSVLRCEVARK